MKNLILKLKKYFNKTISSVKAPYQNYYAVTDTGLVRDHNEDYFIINAEKKIFIVSDGVGGLNAGEIASKEVCEFVNRFFSEKKIVNIESNNDLIHQTLEECIKKAHIHVKQLVEERDGYQYSRMACTLVIGLIIGNRLHISHVGDSRAYLSNKSGIRLLTRDHSVAMELVEEGHITMEEVRTHHMKNRLTQAIGVSEELEPGYCTHKIVDGDVVILCSDGLWDMVSDQDIQDTTRKIKTPASICNALVSKANKAGGKDNTTVCVVFPNGYSDSQKTFPKKK